MCCLSVVVVGGTDVLAFQDGSGVREALKGHRKEITSVQFTKKQHKVIISGDAVGDVRIWHESDQVSLFVSLYTIDSTS